MKDELREPKSSGGLPKTAKPDRKPGRRASALVLESSKLKFEQGPSFDGEKCLDDPDLAAVLVDPRTAQMPPKLWPDPPRVKHNGSWKELHKIYRRWDELGFLELFLASESEAAYRGGLFAVFKSAEWQRLILNALRENSRERGRGH